MKKTAQQISYKVQGQGIPMVILHGLGRSIDHWLGFDDRLAEHCQVIAVENRGIGYSQQAPINLNASIKDYCDDVVAVMDELNIPKAHIMGVSLGGMMALGCGIYNPDRCYSLSVVNSSIAEGWQRLSPLATLALIKASVIPDQREKILVDLLISNMSKKEKVVLAEKMQKVSNAQKATLKLVSSQLIAAGKFFVKKNLGKMRVPTQVILGAKDQFTPPKNSHQIHRCIPNAKLVKIKGGGHEVWHEQPDELASLLVRFAKENMS